MTAEVSLPGSEASPSTASAPEGRRVAKNAGIYLVAQLLSWIGTFCYVSVVPRAFGENIMGQIAFAAVGTNLIGTVFGMGVEPYLVTEIGRDPRRAERLLRATLGLRMLVALPFSIAVWAALFLIHASSFIRYMYLFITVGSLLCLANDPMRAVFAGWEQAKRVALVDILTVIGPLCAIPFLMYGPSVLAYTGLALTIVSTLIHLNWLRGHFCLRPSFDVPLMRDLMRGGMPFIVNDLLAQSSVFITLAILHALINDGAVGIYTQTNRLIGAFMFVSYVVGAALLPAISRLAEQDVARFRAAQTRVFGILVIAGLPVMAGAIVLAAPLCHLLYGNGKFVGMAPVLQCAALTVIPLYIVNTMYQFLIAQRKNQQWTRYLIATYAIGAVGCLLLVPLTRKVWHNGAMGAALAVAFSETCGALFAFTLLGTNPFALGMGWRIARAVGVTAVMASVMWVTREQFILIPIVLGVGVFVAGIWVVQALPEEEQALIVTVFLKKLGRFLPRRAHT